MNILFVVSHRTDWSLDIPGVDVVPADVYLSDAAYRQLAPARVFNLCNGYDYQGSGYYVSLLAQARGHDPLPDVKAIEALRAPHAERLMPAALLPVIAAAFASGTETTGAHTGATTGGTTGATTGPAASAGPAAGASSMPAADAITVHAYFGRAVEARFSRLCEQLFNWLKIPMLSARFIRVAGAWQLDAIATLPAAALPPRHVPLVIDAAADCLHAHHDRLREPSARRPTVAILCGSPESDLPSNSRALEKFMEAAQSLGMQAELITPADVHRLIEFDALFMRETTAIDHYTYHLAREAAHLGLVVIDDADSILRCNNKVYLAELLEQHGIPTPKSLHVDRQHLDEVVPALGLPCILKQPDGAFSLGVVKVGSQAELEAAADKLLDGSDRILAQEFLPTAFDWRIGILDRRPLFVCKYHMARGHWQIIKRGHDARAHEGATEAVPLAEVPAAVLDMALRAANLIGDGFYGVDLKQVGDRCIIIEINDNPNVDAGNEDAILQDDLYRQVMLVFRNRIESRKAHAARRA